MKKKSIALLFILLFLSVNECFSLTKEAETLIVLTHIRNINIHDDLLTLMNGGREFNVRISRQWLQKRILGEKGPGETSGDDYRYRLAIVEKAIREKMKSLILIEFIKPDNADDHVVSYLKPILLELEYKRYFPVRALQDTIDIPLLSVPSDHKEFGRRLAAISRNSMSKLVKKNQGQVNSFFVEGFEVNEEDFRDFMSRIKKVPGSERESVLDGARILEYKGKDSRGGGYELKESAGPGGTVYQVKSEQ